MINKTFVFASSVETSRALVREFVSFVGGRGMTIALEVGGVYVFHTLLGLHDLAVKVALTVIVVVLNYVISRFWIFNK
jgi:putative flippase GtrA